MTDYIFRVTDELKPGDRLVVEYLPKIEPPPPPTGRVVYDQPRPEEITADLPPLPDELHDVNLWHGLAVGVTMEGVRAVYHADHEHGQPYPDWARELFGELIDFTGTEVSYPWQTPNENMLKHPGYKRMGWDWRPFNLPLRVNNAGAVDAAFIFTHAMGTHAAALARIHSFFGAVLLRAPGGGPGGILITGGHADFGQLTVPYKGGPASIVPLANAPQPAYADGTPPYRGHSTLALNDQGHTHWNCVVRRESIPSVEETYHRLLRFAFRQTHIHEYVTGGIQTAEPQFAFYSGGVEFDPDTEYNSSTRNLYQVEVDVPAELAGADGRVNYIGFTDLQGRILPNADQAGPEAVPVQFIDCLPGSYATNYPGPFNGPFDPQNFHDGDVYLDANGRMVDRFARGARPSGWIGAAN